VVVSLLLHTVALPGAAAWAQGGGNSIAILVASAVVAAIEYTVRLGLAWGVVDDVLLNTALVVAKEDLCGVVAVGNKVGV
jgi:hypothetical protein